MGIPIPVNGVTPQRISQAVSKPYVITALATNTGPVYLGLDSAVSPLNYAYPLSPGSSLTWTAISSDVWAVMDVKGTGSIIQAYEASGVASPSPSTVFTKSVSAPVRIGGVFMPYPVGAYSGSTDNGLLMIDISKYSSIFIQVIGGLDQYPTNLRPDAYISLTVAQYPPLNLGTVLGTTNAQYLLGVMGSSLQIPVVNASLYYKLEVSKTAAFNTSGYVSLDIYGTNQVIDAPQYVHSGLDLSGTISTGGIYSISASSTTLITDYAETVNGPVSMSTQNLDSSQGIGFTLYSLESGVRNQLIGVGVAPGAAVYSVPISNFRLPMRPIQVVFQKYAGTGIATGALIQ